MFAAAVFTFYLGCATRFTWNPWPVTPGGAFFDTQIQALFDGRIDVDPRVMGMEGFERDGKTYTYFGILPAILRAPLASQLWRDWTAPSCAMAATLSVLALWYATRRAILTASPGKTQALGLLMLIALVVSGPHFELLGKPSAYVEAVLWSYACACGLLSIGMAATLDGRLSGTRLLALAGLAAAALLTRVSTGLALYAACVLMLLNGGAVWAHQSLSRREICRRLWPAMLVLTLGLGTTLTVNALRWGHPLEFAPLATNRYYAADPRRLARLEKFGTFSARRIPQALGYYLAPGWFFATDPDSARGVRISSMFDGPEGPPLGFPRSHGLWLVLAATGLLALSTSFGFSASQRRGIVALATGLAVAPLLVLSYHYLAFRYRAEFIPLLMVFSVVGVQGVARYYVGSGRLLRIIVLAGCAVLAASQIVAATQAFRAHGCTPYGSYVAAQAASEQCLASGR